MALTIDLMRHGEAEGGSCYRGHKDDPLSPLGWKQMRQALPATRPWSRVISSPLLRCREFAQELAQAEQLPLQLDEAWREIHFGTWEGLTAADIQASDPQALQRYYDDPVFNTPPGGEALLAFKARVGMAWQTLIETHRDEHLLLVTHGGVVRLVLQQVLQFPLSTLFRVQVPLAGVSRIRIDDFNGVKHPSLVFHAGVLT